MNFLRLREEIAALLGVLAAYELPRETKLELWRYYEEIGRYADAEDVLFELLEAEQPPPASMAEERLPDEAVAFYERLLQLDDAALEAGNLPRSEVEEALRELRRRADAGRQPGT